MLLKPSAVKKALNLPVIKVKDFSRQALEQIGVMDHKPLESTLDDSIKKPLEQRNIFGQIVVR